MTRKQAPTPLYPCSIPNGKKDILRVQRKMSFYYAATRECACNYRKYNTHIG
jgi:hypothetical protein